MAATALRAAATGREHPHQRSRRQWVCDLCWNRALLMCEKRAPSTAEAIGGW